MGSSGKRVVFDRDDRYCRNKIPALLNVQYLLYLWIPVGSSSCFDVQVGEDVHLTRTVGVAAQDRHLTLRM